MKKMEHYRCGSNKIREYLNRNKREQKFYKN